MGLLANEFVQRERRLDKLRGRVMETDDKLVEAQRTAAKTQPVLQQRLVEVRATYQYRFMLVQSASVTSHRSKESDCASLYFHYRYG